MDVAALLVELFDRIPPLAHGAVDGLDTEQLVAAPTAEANSIAWLIWHSARVQDHHVGELIGGKQLWTTSGWAARFGLAADPDNTGYGHTPAQVRAVAPTSPDVLCEYLEAVQARTVAWLGTLSAEELDAVVDTRWDPPVTMGVRLVSVADDALQHVGQAAYVRGILSS